jgi:hypothetical protein
MITVSAIRCHLFLHLLYLSFVSFLPELRDFLNPERRKHMAFLRFLYSLVSFQ